MKQSLLARVGFSIIGVGIVKSSAMPGKEPMEVEGRMGRKCSQTIQGRNV